MTATPSSRYNPPSSRPPRPTRAGVAQSVEHRIRNAQVGGSNPSTGTIKVSKSLNLPGLRPIRSRFEPPTINNRFEPSGASRELAELRSSSGRRPSGLQGRAAIRPSAPFRIRSHPAHIDYGRVAAGPWSGSDATRAAAGRSILPRRIDEDRQPAGPVRCPGAADE